MSATFLICRTSKDLKSTFLGKWTISLVKLCWNYGKMCGSHLLHRTGIAVNLLQPVLEKKRFESHERQKAGGKA